MEVHLLQKLLLVGPAAIALLLPTPAGAQSSEDMCSVTETIQLQPAIFRDLIAWIVTKTGWATEEPPSICFVSFGQLRKIYYGNGDASNDLQIHALYSVETHKVYLLENWHPDDLHDRAALLHELLHYLQQLNNVKAACLAANELQAYHLQLEWIREQDIQDPYKFLDIEEFTIKLLSQCDD